MASELQLPQHYVELDEQEMTYVDGGWKIATVMSNGFCSTISSIAFGGVMLTTGYLVAAGISFAAAALKIAAGITGILSGMGPVGWTVLGIVGAWAACNWESMVELCFNVVTAAVQGRRCEVGLDWFSLYSKVV